jgi:uncharacterized Zn-finger protein
MCHFQVIFTFDLRSSCLCTLIDASQLGEEFHKMLSNSVEEILDNHSSPKITKGSPLISNGETKLYSCTICEQKLTTKSHLRRHIQSVHEGKKPFKCQACQNTFTSSQSLNGHISSNHEGIKRKTKLYPCTICGKNLTSKSHLKEHVAAVHEEKRPFKCEFCLNTSFNKSNNFKKL